jgi:hypothetical protein
MGLWVGWSGRVWHGGGGVRSGASVGYTRSGSGPPVETEG